MCRLSSIPGVDFSVWYLDDGTLAGSEQGVYNALQLLHTLGPQRGLFLNTKKTHLWWPNLSLLPDVSLQFRSLDRTLLRPPGDGVSVLGSPVSHLPSYYKAALSARVNAAISAIHSLSPLRDPQVQLLLLRSCLGSCRLIYLLRSIPPLLDMLPPLRSFDNTLTSCLREDILGHAQYFGSLQILLSSLPLSKGGLGITKAVDLFSFAFLSSSLDTQSLQAGLLASVALPPTDPAIHSALALAPPIIRTAYAQIAASDGTSVTPQRGSSSSSTHTARGTSLRGADRALAGSDEDTVSATPSSQSFLAEQFFVAAAAQACDLVDPEHAPRFRSFLQCLQMRGSSYWLLAVPISGLQQTLDGLHYRALLRYRLCMQMFLEQALCPSCEDAMDVFGDHAVRNLKRNLSI